MVSFARQNAKVVPITSQETNAVLSCVSEVPTKQRLNSLVMYINIDYLHSVGRWNRCYTWSRNTTLFFGHNIWASYQVGCSFCILTWCQWSDTKRNCLVLTWVKLLASNVRPWNPGRSKLTEPIACIRILFTHFAALCRTILQESNVDNHCDFAFLSSWLFDLNFEVFGGKVFIECFSSQIMLYHPI